MKWIKSFRAINKRYITLPDIVKITGMAPSSVHVLLNRLIKQGELIRLTINCYILPETTSELTSIANQLVFPSYMSFESILSQTGVLSQMPFTLSFATLFKTKHIHLGERNVEYRQIKPNLFWGYVKQTDGLWIAEPEKALFDLIYFVSIGKSKTDLSILDYNKINLPVVRQMLTDYHPSGLRILEKAGII